MAPKSESSAHQVDEPIYTSALVRWRRDMPPKNLKKFMKIGGPTLEMPGYPAV